MTANPHRGEVALELPGASWVLRPSHTALMAVEERLGRPSLDLAMEARARRFGYREVITVIDCCLVRAGRAPDQDEIGRKVFEAGLGNEALLEALYEVWAMALRGPEKPGGNAEAPATAEGPTPSATAGASPVGS